jgi:hypothetical protein
MMADRRKVLRPRRPYERAVRVVRYDPQTAARTLQTRLRFLALGFECWPALVDPDALAQHDERHGIKRNPAADREAE